MNIRYPIYEGVYRILTLKRINRVELRDRYRLVEIGYHKAHLKNEIGGLYGRSIFLFFPFIFFRSRLLLEFCFIIGVDY